MLISVVEIENIKTMNCGNKLEKRLEKEIKKKRLKKGGGVRLIKKNNENKNTQTKKFIISTLSKETNLSKIGDNNEVSKKLMKS